MKSSKLLNTYEASLITKINRVYIDDKNKVRKCIIDIIELIKKIIERIETTKINISSLGNEKSVSSFMVHREMATAFPRRDKEDKKLFDLQRAA